VLIEKRRLHLMSPQRRVLRESRTLLDLENSQAARFLLIEEGSARVQPCLAYPILLPLFKREAEILLLELDVHAFDKIVQRGVRERILAEVVLHREGEALLSHQAEQLAQSGGALRIGDSVKDRVRRLRVRDLAGDGVGGWQLIRGVARRLVLVEVEPDADQTATFDLDVHQRVEGDEISEALVEPEVIPSLHRHEVAEPVMRELVRYCVA